MTPIELIAKLIFLGWTDEMLTSKGFTYSEIEEARRYAEGDLQYGY